MKRTWPARTWQAERAEAVRMLRWYAQRYAERGCDHEARVIRGLARCIEQGQHCMEGPPAALRRQPRRKR